MNIGDVFDQNDGKVMGVARKLFDKYLIEEAGRRTNFNKVEMAKMLGLSLTSLYNQIRSTGAQVHTRLSNVEKIEIELYRMKKGETKIIQGVSVLFDGVFYRTGSFKSGMVLRVAKHIHD